MQTIQSQNIAISSTLDAEQLNSTEMLNFHLVVDLRRDQNGRARAIEETTLKKLQNLRIGYEQLPCEPSELMSDGMNPVSKFMDEGTGPVMVLTDQVAAMANFCLSQGIPFTSNELYLVESGRGLTPKHAGQGVPARTQLRRIAS